MFSQRFRKPTPKQDSDSCKIKIKNTKNGREIIFSGKCSREQLEMAKQGSGAEEVRESQDY